MMLSAFSSRLGLGTPDKQIPVEHLFCGDLHSWALCRMRENSAWITVMNNENTVAVALLRKAACVILADGVSPTEEARRAAQEHGVVLLQSEKSAAALCAEAAALLGGV